jgi:hypothetical protein
MQDPIHGCGYYYGQDIGKIFGAKGRRRMKLNTLAVV